MEKTSLNVTCNKTSQNVQCYRERRQKGSAEQSKGVEWTEKGPLFSWIGKPDG